MSKPIPQRLKRLESSDLIPMKDSNGDFLVVTKQETTKVIHDLVKAEIMNAGDDFIHNQRKELEAYISKRFTHIEKSIDAFIEHKFDTLAEKVCDMLITRKFTEEVNKKVNEKINKKINGRF